MNSIVRILVVDDDPDILNSTARLLERADYAVDRASSGEEALQAVWDHRPNLLLLDCDLPGIDGIEVCRRIKRDPALADIIVVIVSASRTESDAKVEGFESGADGYITRPIPNSELLAWVKSYVRIFQLTFSMREQTRQLKEHSEILRQGRLAALNLMEDAANSRDQIEKAYKALRESKELLTEMTTQIPGVVYQFYARPGGEMGFYYISDRSEQTIGIKADLEGYLERFVALVIPEHRESFIKSIEKSVKESSEWKYEGMLQKPTGEKIWFFGNSTPSPRENEMVFNGLISDITARKKMEEELKDYQEQLFQTSKLASLGQLSAGAAHEINNPLAGIVGFTEATLLDLKNKKVVPERIVHDLKIILKNAERCKVIISNLLNFARAKELRRHEIDVNSLIDDTLALVEYRTTAQNIKVVKKYEKNQRKVSIDQDQMTQVLINVISNAQNAMPDGGELLIRTSSENNFELIELKDNGIGIEKENLLRVFDPFFTTREPGQGVGLGLSISYSIMKRHKGSIEAKSDGKNKGASFIIKIPV